jgi:hypothetical protein
MEKGRQTFNILTVKPRGKRPLRKTGRKWKVNIRMDFKEIDINTRNCVYSAQELYWRALVNVALKD